jgi:hypothetical protein
VQLAGGVGPLLHHFNGSGQFDTVPANVIPPTIQCTGCSLGEGKHPFGSTTFKVGYVGRMSRVQRILRWIPNRMTVYRRIGLYSLTGISKMQNAL